METYTDESAFIDAVNTMWDYDYYRTMRLISSTAGVAFECYDPPGEAIIADILDWEAFQLYDNDRVSTTSYFNAADELVWGYTSLEQGVDALDNGAAAWTELQEHVNTPNPALLPIPDVDPLPIVEGQCSAEVSVIPTATVNCLETIFGTTEDPLFYAEQGEYTITWTYDDGNGNTVDQTQTVVIQDTTPPDINLSLSPDVLWPPNRKMVEVVPTIEVDDACCASDITVALVSITIDEADTGRPLRRWLRRRGDIRIWDGKIYLRAERAGNSDGRTYTITYQATDCNGNTSTATGTVRVPHDRRRRSRP